MDASEAEALTLAEVENYRDDEYDEDEDGSSSLRSDLEFHHHHHIRKRDCRSIIIRSRWIMMVAVIVVVIIMIFAAVGGRNGGSNPPLVKQHKNETTSGDANAHEIPPSDIEAQQQNKDLDLDQKNADLDLGDTDKKSVTKEQQDSAGQHGNSTPDKDNDGGDKDASTRQKTEPVDDTEDRRPDDNGGFLDDDLPYDIIVDYMRNYSGFYLPDSLDDNHNDGQGEDQVDGNNNDELQDDDDDDSTESPQNKTDSMDTATSTSGDDAQEKDESTSAQGTWFEDDKKSSQDENDKNHDDKTDAPTARPSAQPSNDLASEGGVSEQENDTLSSPTVSHDTATSTEEADQSPTMQPAQVVAPPQSTTYQYRRRGNPSLDHSTKEALAKDKGHWTLVDPKRDQRPTEDYCASYPSRDIPWEEFPENAWQKDADYRSQFLGEGKRLVERAMEAHLAEYGFGTDDIPGEDFETRRDQSPFRLDFFEIDDEDERRELGSNNNDRGGRTTQKSYDGLVRRLLHAVVSGDTFNLVLGGHSAAAGHGNHFQQSYTLQFQRIMEPVLARLGVKNYARNTGMGGLGTIHNAMGAQDIYGKDVDILVWDSAMTENGGSPDFDLFARQGILGSDRAPMLWSGQDDRNVYPALQKHADVDYMIYGTGKGAIPSISDPSRLNEIPWAARYLKCDNDYKSLCSDNRYNGTCWIERPDHFKPPTKQNAEPGGRASWHGGNREHQLTGRLLSFTVLRALYSALDLWDKQPEHNLQDSMWHMSDYYDNIKSKVANLDPSVGTCYEIKGKLTTAFCRIPFQGRSEFTPRANPDATSLRSIMKPFGPNFRLPQPEQNIYDPPDVYNPVLGVPDGEVDYLSIVENGDDYLPFEAPASPVPATNSSNRLIELTVDAEGENIVPGLGWGLQTRTSPHLCNGTYDSFCGRSSDSECLLYGHNDFRGGLSFDSLSGWGVFTLRNLRHGMIYVKMDSWRPAKDNPVTEGWTKVNNDTDGRSLSASSQQEPDDRQRDNGFRRRLKKKKEDNQNFCPDFMLEFAVGEEIVQIPSDEILGKKHSLVQRVVQIWTVLDDPDFTNGEAVDVELGIRIRGCGRKHVFWVSHIYWA